MHNGRQPTRPIDNSLPSNLGIDSYLRTLMERALSLFLSFPLDLSFPVISVGSG